MDVSWISQLDGPSADGPWRGPLADARRQLGDGPVRWVCATAQEMTGYIVDRAPGSDTPDDGSAAMPPEAVQPAAEALLAAGLRLMAGVPDPPGVAQEAVDLVRESVCRGLPLHRVLRGVRLGHEFAYRALRDVVPADAMPAVTEALFGQADRLASVLAGIYVSEQDRWENSGEASRHRVAEAIIAGEERDAAAAESILGYALDRRHVAVVLWREDRRRAEACPEEVSARLLAACGGDGWVHVAGRGGAVWGWIGFPAAPAPAPWGPVTWPERLPSGWRAAAGPPAHGLAGMRRSHLGARQAARIAAALPGLPAVCDFADYRTVGLLTRDAEQARWYVEETLGPLAARDKRTGQLRETLRCYLAHDRSLKTAAEQLGVARNTVAYRVGRVQEMLGDVTGSLTVRLALEIMRFPGALESAGAAGQQANIRQMYIKTGSAGQRAG